MKNSMKYLSPTPYLQLEIDPWLDDSKFHTLQRIIQWALYRPLYTQSAFSRYVSHHHQRLLSSDIFALTFGQKRPIKDT